METAFSNAGMWLERRVHATHAQIEQLLRDPKVQSFLNLFTEANSLVYSRNRDQKLLCVGIILLTIGKNVNPQNYDRWVKNKLSTFGGVH
jgi:hypothetical protein